MPPNHASLGPINRDEESKTRGMGSTPSPDTNQRRPDIEHVSWTPKLLDQQDDCSLFFLVLMRIPSSSNALFTKDKVYDILYVKILR